MKKLTISLLLILFVGYAFCQSEINLQVTTPAGSNFNFLYPTHFDPDNPSLQPELFKLKLQNTQDESQNCVIRFNMSWRGEMLVDEAYIGKVNDFIEIPAGNTIIISSKQVITNTPTVYASDVSWSDMLDESQEFEDIILDSGKFPDGEYYFEFEVLDEVDGNALSEMQSASITIKSPVPIKLITPGSPIGLGASLINDLNPYFAWFSNFPQYTIKIYELEGEVDAPDQIENIKDPYFETQCNKTSFSYPASANPLSYGKTYAWQVTAKLISPTGSSEDIYESRFYVFEISNQGGQESDNNILINILKQTNVEGAGEVISLLQNGYEVDREDIDEILRRISAGENIKRITVQ